MHSISTCTRRSEGLRGTTVVLVLVLVVVTCTSSVRRRITTCTVRMSVLKNVRRTSLADSVGQFLPLLVYYSIILSKD